MLGIRNTKRLVTAIHKNIILTIYDRVALIQLNRPTALNSLNLELMNEIRESLSNIQNNESLSCVVLTGDSKSFAGT